MAHRWPPLNRAYMSHLGLFSAVVFAFVSRIVIIRPFGYDNPEHLPSCRYDTRGLPRTSGLKSRT